MEVKTVEYTVSYLGNNQFSAYRIKPVMIYRGSFERIEETLLRLMLTENVVINNRCKGKEQKEKVEGLAAKLEGMRPKLS